MDRTGTGRSRVIAGIRKQGALAWEKVWTGVGGVASVEIQDGSPDPVGAERWVSPSVVGRHEATVVVGGIECPGELQLSHAAEAAGHSGVTSRVALEGQLENDENHEGRDGGQCLDACESMRCAPAKQGREGIHGRRGFL